MKRKKLLIMLVIVVSISLVGCGGAYKPFPTRYGVVTGNTTDINGQPIVSADIWVDGLSSSSTQSTQAGIYKLFNVPEGYNIIKAHKVINGVAWRGQNVVDLIVDGYSNRQKNINIVLVQESKLCGLDGYVRDRYGYPLANARVTAFHNNELSSATDITDNNGYYRIWGLVDGLTYTVVASGNGYENDTARNVVVSAGRVDRLSFTLYDSNNPRLDKPTGLYAVAWTAPENARWASGSVGNAYQSIKQRLDNRLLKSKASILKKKATGSSIIEIDLYWNYVDDPALMGYGIHRGISMASIPAIEFIKDPTANFFADQDEALNPGTTYYYQISAVNTDYPYGSGSASPKSDIADAKPMRSLNQMSVNPESLLFTWNSVQNTVSYKVLVYPRFPDYNVEPTVERNVGLSLQWSYNGPALQTGRTYYWVVVAQGDYDGQYYNAYSLSPVQSFIAP